MIGLQEGLIATVVGKRNVVPCGIAFGAVDGPSLRVAGQTKVFFADGIANASACGMTPFSSSSSSIVPPIAGRPVAVAPQYSAPPALLVTTGIAPFEV